MTALPDSLKGLRRKIDEIDDLCFPAIRALYGCIDDRCLLRFPRYMPFGGASACAAAKADDPVRPSALPRLCMRPAPAGRRC